MQIGVYVGRPGERLDRETGEPRYSAAWLDRPRLVEERGDEERPPPDLSGLERELAKPENAPLLDRLLDGLEEIIRDRLGLSRRHADDEERDDA